MYVFRICDYDDRAFRLEADVWLVLSILYDLYRQGRTSCSRGGTNGRDAGGTGSSDPTASSATSISTGLTRSAPPSTAPVRVNNTTPEHDTVVIINIILVDINGFT